MIEALSVAQAEDMAALHAQAFEKPWSAREIDALLSNSAAFALAASSGGAYCGFILAWAAAGDAEVLTLAVAPGARRRGVATMLANAAAAAALLRGASAMHLDVSEANDAARALYAKLGYEEVGRRPNYYRDAGREADAIVLRRSLPRPAI